MPKASLIPVPSTSVLPHASARIERLLTKKGELNAQKKAIQEELDTLNNKLVRAVKAEGKLDDKGRPAVLTDDNVCPVIKGENRYTNPKKLIALGVKPSIVEKATDITPYEYVGVFQRGDKK